MKHLNGHETQIIPGSLKRSAIGGMEFHLRCCGEHEHSVHIQNAHEFHNDKEALKRVVEDHHRLVANRHAAHLAVEGFMQENCVDEDCGCGG